MDEYSKNSLLGQLEQSGIFGENSPMAEYLPFGILTGSTDCISPFKNEIKEEKPEPKIVKKRLNDLDLNIFQEGNYLDIKDNELTNEEKIKKIKGMIKKIDEKIFMLEDFEDDILFKKLNDEKEALLETLKLLVDDEPCFISQNVKVKDFASKMHIKEKLRKIEKFVFRFFPVLRKNFLVRHALNKLVMLNESAKELMLKKTPYGEQEGRYSDFVAYLSCANVIHAKLTKKM